MIRPLLFRLPLLALATLTAWAGCSGSDDPSENQGTPCSELQSCCDELPAASRPSCEAVVSSGVAAQCTTAFQNFVAASQCVGGGGGGGMSCSELDACCAQLPAAQQASCQATVLAGAEAPCATALQGFVATSQCQGGGGGGGGMSCGELDSCCMELPAAQQPSCQATVMAGSDAACATALQGYVGASLCGGGGMACDELDSCCVELPAGQQQSCQATVMGGSDAQCTAALTGFRVQGFCEEGGGGGGDSPMNCGEAYTCVANCADQECFADCVSQLSEASGNLLGALFDCEFDFNCVGPVECQMACAAERNACQADPG